MQPRIQHYCGPILLAVALCLARTDLAGATEHPDLVPQDAAVEEKLGEPVDTSLTFRTETGEERALRELMPQDRPVIIIPMYYTCPRLCKLTSAAMVTLINSLDLSLGEDYTVLSVSFDSTETPELAHERGEHYRGMLDKPAAGSWHFLTGTEGNVAALMNQIGFGYKKDGEEFSHSAVMVILTPEGTIARYFYGITYPRKDVRFALVEAAAGRIGTTVDKILLFCFRFDPTKGKYTLVVMNVMNIACLGVLAVLVTSLVTMKIRER